MPSRVLLVLSIVTLEVTPLTVIASEPVPKVVVSLSENKPEVNVWALARLVTSRL